MNKVRLGQVTRVEILNIQAITARNAAVNSSLINKLPIALQFKRCWTQDLMKQLHMDTLTNA